MELWKFTSKNICTNCYLQNEKNVKNAPYVLYVTENFLQQRYPCLGKTTNVSNVEIDKILDENLTKRLNKIENKKQLTKIGMIGNLNNRIKGWDIALKALKLLKKK